MIGSETRNDMVLSAVLGNVFNNWENFSVAYLHWVDVYGTLHKSRSIAIWDW